MMFKTAETRKSLKGRSGIYKISLIGTNRHYVGQSRNLHKRMRSHINDAYCHYAKIRKSKIAYAIEKYGAEAFEFSVLAFCDVGNLNWLEEQWILRFNCCEEGGFNIKESESRDGYNPSTPEEVREKIRIANTGKKRSPETLKRMRESALKKPSITEETRQKMRDSQKGHKGNENQKRVTRERLLGKKLPESWRKALKLGAQKRAIPVHKFDKAGNLVAAFSSVSEASEKTGCATGNLVSTLKGRLKSCGGYLWKYAVPASN